MLGLGILALLAVTAVSTTASPVLRTRSPYAVKDSHHVPRSWSRVGPAPAEHVINLQIGLKQGQFDELERHLYEVSDPTHERYGQHLSVDQVNELVKPSDETLELVHDWLDDMGITLDNLEYSPARDWIKVSLLVGDVERLLDTEYSVYQHDQGGHMVRTPEWSLPRHLHEHIDAIQPTNSFFRTTPHRSNVMVVDKDFAGPLKLETYSKGSNLSVAAVCNASSVTPTCLRTLYNTIDYVPQVPGKNKVGLTDYLGESNNRSDVSLFLQQFRPEAAGAAYNFTVEIINNGNNQQTPNTPEQNEDGKDEEGDLDAETILSIGWPTPLTAYTTGGAPPFKADAYTTTDTNEPYLLWVQYVLNQTNVPQVISTSYGDDEQTVPPSYAHKVCSLFAQLGARGVSLLFSSGDSGVGATGYCYSNDGKNTSTFLPAFPSSCPYITSVGATRNFFPETAALDELSDGSTYTSGGGYSNYFSRPAYQSAAVANYTAGLGSLYSGLYNASGRAYPDIAAQGQRYVTTWDGSNILLDGTSASTPAATAILSLVNDALIAAGRSPLGFLNPWLYQGGWKAFNDITNGSSAGCGTDGFAAKSGWDPVTGWGTPDFKAILSVLGLGYDAK